MGKKSLILFGAVVLLAGTVTACGYHRNDAESVAEYAEWMVERVSRKMDLNEVQKAKLGAIKAKLLTLREEHQARREESRKEVLALLSQPTLDRARAQALVEGHVERVRTAAPEVIALLGDFYDSLTPEQQRLVRERVESRFGGRRHHWH